MQTCPETLPNGGGGCQSVNGLGSIDLDRNAGRLLRVARDSGQFARADRQQRHGRNPIDRIDLNRRRSDPADTPDPLLNVPSSRVVDETVDEHRLDSDVTDHCDSIHELLQREVAALRENQARSYEAFFDEPFKPGRTPFKLIEDKLVKITGKGKGAGRKANLKKYFGVIQALKDIVGAIDMARVDVGGKGEKIYPEYLDFELKLKQDPKLKSKIKLQVNTQEEADAIADALRKMKLFKAGKALVDSSKNNKVTITQDLNPRKR